MRLKDVYRLTLASLLSSVLVFTCEISNAASVNVSSDQQSFKIYSKVLIDGYLISAPKVMSIHR